MSPDYPGGARLADHEAAALMPYMIELAALIEPAVADRLIKATEIGAVVRQAVIEPARVDLVLLARWIARMEGKS